jgi:hypothetical protein
MYFVGMTRRSKADIGKFCPEVAWAALYGGFDLVQKRCVPVQGWHTANEVINGALSHELILGRCRQEEGCAQRARV